MITMTPNDLEPPLRGLEKWRQRRYVKKELRSATQEQREVWRLLDMFCRSAVVVPELGNPFYRPRSRYARIPTQQEAIETLRRIGRAP